MKYEVRTWKDGYGIWQRWWRLSWRVRKTGPFGLNCPWVSIDLAQGLCDKLNKPKGKE